VKSHHGQDFLILYHRQRIGYRIHSVIPSPETELNPIRNESIEEARGEEEEARYNRVVVR
jgi:hypothetical protein